MHDVMCGCLYVYVCVTYINTITFPPHTYISPLPKRKRQQY